MGDENNLDWPEPIYFPQAQPEAPNAQAAPHGGAPAGTKPSEQTIEKKKKKRWPFGKSQAKSKPLTEAQITKVGPKDPPPSPYPLLRLSMPIETGSGTITPGIYLVKPGEESSNPDSVELGSYKRFILTRENKPILVFKVHPVNLPDENMALTGTPSPLSSTKPIPSTIARAETQISGDLKSLVIVLKEGDNRLESDPFPISIDKRHILSF
jgi:hypothetical protein